MDCLNIYILIKALSLEVTVDKKSRVHLSNPPSSASFLQ